MNLSAENLKYFEDGVQNILALLPDAPAEKQATGIRNIGIAKAHLEGPEAAYKFAEDNCFELELGPEDSSSVWEGLGVAGVAGAVEQVRVRTGIQETKAGITVRKDVDIADMAVGNQLFGLVGIGDHAAMPLARQHLEKIHSDPKTAKYSTRRAMLLHRAGDPQAVDLTLRFAKERKEPPGPDNDTSANAWINNALWGLIATMLKRGEGQKIEEALELMDDSSSKANALADCYVTGAFGSDFAERALLMHAECGSFIRGFGGDVADKLVRGGFQPLVTVARTLFIDPATRMADMATSYGPLVALHDYGEAAAADRLVDVAKVNPREALGHLDKVGRTTHMERQARELFQAEPSRQWLQCLLQANFTPQDWAKLWDLPLDIRASYPSDGIWYRASDLIKFAEHFTDKKIRVDWGD